MASPSQALYRKILDSPGGHVLATDLDKGVALPRVAPGVAVEVDSQAPKESVCGLVWPVQVVDVDYADVEAHVFTPHSFGCAQDRPNLSPLRGKGEGVSVVQGLYRTGGGL